MSIIYKVNKINKLEIAIFKWTHLSIKRLAVCGFRDENSQGLRTMENHVRMTVQDEDNDDDASDYDNSVTAGHDRCSLMARPFGLYNARHSCSCFVGHCLSQQRQVFAGLSCRRWQEKASWRRNCLHASLLTYRRALACGRIFLAREYRRCQTIFDARHLFVGRKGREGKKCIVLII